MLDFLHAQGTLHLFILYAKIRILTIFNIKNTDFLLFAHPLSCIPQPDTTKSAHFLRKYVYII